MDSMINLSDFIYIQHERMFEAREGRDFTGYPFLMLNFFYSIDGERVEGITNEYWHRLAEFGEDFSIRDFVEVSEPLPMDTMVDPEDVESERDMIAEAVALLVQGCDGVEGMKGLKVDVTVEVNRMEEECVVMNMDYVDVLRERRLGMCSMVERRKGMGDEECAICLDEMMGVEDGVVRTPCSHRFHGSCLGKWFRENCSCPLCRFMIGPF